MISTEKIRKLYSVIAGCLGVLGILLVIGIQFNQHTFNWICGIILIVFGIVKVMGYFSNDLMQLAFQFDFAIGVVSILTGVVLLRCSQEMYAEGVLTLTVAVVSDAVLRIKTAFDAKKVGVSCWWIILIFAAVTIALGISVLVIASSVRSLLSRTVGITLIMEGIFNVYLVQSTVIAGKRSKKWEA